jgi:hypothetical protein
MQDLHEFYPIRRLMLLLKGNVDSTYLIIFKSLI